MESVRQPQEILHGGGVALSCGVGGELRAEELHGLFAGDTRVLSTWRLAVSGWPWRVIGRVREGPAVARWDLQNPPVRAPGGELPGGRIHCRITRRVSGALHDDLAVTLFGAQARTVRLTLLVDADFCDIFEVAERRPRQRLGAQRLPGSGEMRFAYERGTFRRGVHVTFVPSHGEVTFVGSQAIFDLPLEPGRTWHCCVEAVPEVDGRRLEFEGDPHAPPPRAVAAAPWLRAPALLHRPFRRARIDLEHLTLHGDGGAPFVAAGAPWFLTLFGRDTLITALMTGLLGPSRSVGALAELAATQAKVFDDFRDAQPGKIAHEMRRGELARFLEVPHSPYYGTHDAPALYALALWSTFRWTGDRALLDRFLPAAEAALAWCRDLGDADGDGLLEYGTRSRVGYRHQGWKDAADAIPHEDGTQAEAPVATVELQGYLYAARLALAELLEVVDRDDEAEALRGEARALRRLVEERFWMEDAGCYALALDGRKRLVRSIASNAGHLLWCGLPSRERVVRTAERLMASDMFSGWGVRTLSASHRCYNPLSYHTGSVWPHDSALLAAGLVRYGLHAQAARILEGLLEAAGAFEHDRLPELFCGFDRRDGPPVPYERANVPQAWAAAVPVLAAQLFLGLQPDVHRGRCHLAPWLPEWLPELELEGVELGGGSLGVAAARSEGETRLARAEHPSLELVSGEGPPAPLWGAVVEGE
ncbi:MAG TPA: glycogen debranching N-terminal domain-containing protein [Longimicrobiales bacterium]|nr:glycogen debranching N-terminal domain-containing protein [Longimicrobiales bacterium]